jgi:exodeoxyribonuclease VII large subunit
VNEISATYSVSEITGKVRRALEEGFGTVRVRGEISNLRRPASGHLYFALKDEAAQLRAVLFRGAAVGLRFLPADGLEVVAEGEITVYEPRGDLQLLVRSMLPSGLGALMQALEKLRRQLEGEGLFDVAHKQPLPAYPRTLAFITSPSGAAVRDLLQVTARRWPLARRVIVPVRVQGEGAAEEIARAVDLVNRWGRADVIVVGRGGGSLEDLWAFNEEVVVRAVHASRVPVVSAVGHETDTTLCDLVADVRAPTPSAAAELVVPEVREIADRLTRGGTRLERAFRRGLENRQRAVARLVAAYGLRRPEAFLARRAQRLDELAQRLERRIREESTGRRMRLQGAASRLAVQHPLRRVRTAETEVRSRQLRLEQAMGGVLSTRRTRVVGLGRALRALDPTSVLERGYCLVFDPRSGRIVRAGKGLDVGAPVLVQFHEDRARVEVLGIEPGRRWPEPPDREGDD